MLLKRYVSLHRFYYPHRSRDPVSPVCGIFFVHHCVYTIFVLQGISDEASYPMLGTLVLFVDYMQFAVQCSGIQKGLAWSTGGQGHRL